VTEAEPLLGRRAIEEAFGRLGDRLVQRGVIADIYVFGGAATALLCKPLLPLTVPLVLLLVERLAFLGDQMDLARLDRRGVGDGAGFAGCASPGRSVAAR
jgi:hypothetical protein